MALTKGDWSVAANGDIREVAGTSQHEVIEMHRWLMDLLDDTSATGDDLVDVSNGIIPSARSTDNIIALNTPYNIDQTVSERFYNGSMSYNDGDDLYSGLRVVGSVSGTTQIQIIQDNALVTSYWGTGLNAVPAESILLQIMLKTRTAGADIDGKRIRTQARELGDTYAEFSVTLGTAFGVAALFTGTDDFNQTLEATIAGWASIVVTEGYSQIDVDGNSVDENYICSIDQGTQTTPDTYERGKWIGRRGTSTTIFGLNGSLFRGITHDVDVTNILSGPLTQSEELTWTEAGTVSSGQLLAADSLSAPGTLWIQLTTGIAPTNTTTLTGGTSGATVDVDTGGTTPRTINPNSWLGNYAGSLTGNFGIGVEAADLTNINDSLRALDNIARNPPNNVQLIATSLVVGDILFAAKTKEHTSTVSGAHSIGDTTLTLASGIPVDYDTIGRIVVDGVEHAFTAYSGADVPIGGSGLKAALAGGEDISVIQFFNDEFLTTADAGTVNGSGDVIVEFTVAPGSAWPSAGVVWLWDGVDRYDEYSYTSISGDQLLGISPALSQSYGSIPGYLPFVSETAVATSISKTIVYPGSAVPGRWRLYNSAANITPFEVNFSIEATGSSTPMTRISDA